MTPFLCPHPENPRYFLFRGRATALVTATEHYGSVGNTAFDYTAYLDMLAEYGFNLTRVVLTMRESETEFKGAVGYQNTCCPRLEHLLAPWARSGLEGAADGGPLFDLDRWDERFFTRLKDFCAAAGERNIAVEVTLFSQLYSASADSPWVFCPLNPANNVQREGAPSFDRYTTDENDLLFRRQRELALKTAAELADFDNVYYEICNEPPYPEENHPSALSEETISRWQNRLGKAIYEFEASLPARHMLAVGDPHESVDLSLFSILNFHYREWAENGLVRYGSAGKALAFDETLTGVVSWNRELDFQSRRKEAWEFFFRGFGVYDYLDFTVATDDPRGEGRAEFPGGQYFDGTVMRRSLAGLRAFLSELDLARLSPFDDLFDPSPAVCGAWALGGGEKDSSDQLAFYLNGAGLASVRLRLPRGCFLLRLYDPSRRAWLGEQVLEGTGEPVLCRLPVYESDVAGILDRRG